MSTNRRRFIQATAGTAIGLSMLGAPAIAQARTKVKVGYLHTLAVDGQIWTGMNRGSFEKQGLDLDLVQFTTGLEIFQAMIGGSIDMLATGAVLSNFPARGQGKVFLINNVEFATAQLWVREDMGIKSFADLKGKKISTTTGTTAHVFLDTALRANGVDPNEGRRDREPADVRGGDFVHFRRGAGGGAVGSLQHHRARQGAGREDARGRVEVLPGGSDRRRLGDNARTTTTRTTTCFRASSAAGWKRTTTS